MAKKVKLTRPELKKQRDALIRFERYLPMLKLKQQQLQMTMREVLRKRREALAEAKAAREKFRRYENVLTDLAGLNVRDLAKCEKVETSELNVAGVNVPVFEGVSFKTVVYSLFATPVWVDRALADLREVNGHRARADVFQKQFDLLNRELVKIIQRVNLFEKIKIPESREIIRVIRIKLGDEMTAAVGRAKIAKGKLVAEDATIYTSAESEDKSAEADPQ